ncbi:MAG: DnaJ domain-containing protein [Candidatus Kapabacteria bacterium]|nr:DnaJ domain-containing protein [Candidatus Kapabacteria bacterium]
MWQIINRISKLVQSNSIKSSDSYKILNQEDEELKRIIDELNNKKESDKKSENTSKSSNISDDVKNAFAELGVPPNADSATIKSAYRSKMKEFHPDRFVNLDKDLQEKSRRKSQELNSAYDILEKAGFVK